MATEYNKLSPYYITNKFGQFLDVLNQRSIPKNVNDVKFTINAIYQYRPDLLANDLYGDPALWWVFAMRNPNIIQDPIFDFKSGKIIFVPTSETLTTALGI